MRLEHEPPEARHGTRKKQPLRALFFPKSQIPAKISGCPGD